MSFNVPIFFDDSPFFEGDSFFRRRPLNRRDSDEERQPGYFQTWANYDPIFEEPSESFINRPTYRNRARREVPARSFQRRECDREFEDENNDDSEELSGVMRDLSGLNGWDIPVQFVGPTDYGNKPRHSQRQAREPQQYSKGNVEEMPAPRQREKVVLRPKHAKNVRERMDAEVQTVGDQMKEENEMTKVERKPKNMAKEDEKEADLSERNKENESATEIPVQHSNKRQKSNDGRRHSRRLSQCDPPALAEIKIARVKSILEKVDGMDEKIKEFKDALQNKNFLLINETLMSALLDLDNIDSDGLDVVRFARKEAVKTIQNLVEKLENKLAENKSKEAS